MHQALGAAGYGRCSVAVTQRDPTPAPDTFVCFYATRGMCAFVFMFVCVLVCLYSNERGSPFIYYCAWQRERDREGERERLRSCMYEKVIALGQKVGS